MKALWPWGADCRNFDLQEPEHKVDRLAENQEIRQDQAQARKEALQEAWLQYTGGEVSCQNFLDKVEFLTQP